jgi:hypothetical protein
VDAILAYVKAGKRVCSQQAPWRAMWEILRAGCSGKAVNQPRRPLVGEGWETTSALMKRHRLKAQLERAQSVEALDDATRFLRSLADKDWAYGNDFVPTPPSQLASNGPPRSNEQARTVSIWIRIVNGQLLEFGGGPLPILTDCVGDLIVPAFALTSRRRTESDSSGRSSLNYLGGIPYCGVA